MNNKSYLTAEQAYKLVDNCVPAILEKVREASLLGNTILNIEINNDAAKESLVALGYHLRLEEVTSLVQISWDMHYWNNVKRCG